MLPHPAASERITPKAKASSILEARWYRMSVSSQKRSDRAIPNFDPIEMSGVGSIAARQAILNVFGVVLVLRVVAAVLTFEVHLVLLHVGVEHVVGAHAEHLRDADEEVKQVHDFDARVLLVELLVFGPPFPRNAVGEFGDFLGHGAAIV